ncbi:MAG: hypothetical protein PPP58_06915 [Natronomonas sp.]
MKRRHAIAAFGTVVVGLAGCFEADAPEDDPDPVTEEPRIDEPPYAITEPDPPGDPDGDYDELYLGRAMPTDPSRSFRRLSDARLRSDARRLTDLDAAEEFHVRAVTDDETRAATFDTDDAASREAVESVDLDESTLVVVESGYGSGSIRHRFRRAEATDDGIHLHGFYTQPFVQTDDYTSRDSTIAVDVSPPGLVRVSLTVAPDRRVHFNSTEGVVTVED